MKRPLVVSAFFLLSFALNAQETLKLSRAETEKLFLQRNLLLISKKLNIESQRAEVIQAKLWPNPELSISEINLWKNASVDPSPPLLGNMGRNQQIAFELNQLVQTAGKRKKWIALEEVNVARAEQYFEDLLRNLKLELRSLLTELQYTQQSLKVHQYLLENISVLTTAYQNQLRKGHISQAELIRLKAQELQISKAQLELARQSNEIQKELKLLLRLPPETTVEITDEGFPSSTHAYESLSVDQAIERAKENRPDYKGVLLEEDYANKLLAYEKAQRVPDLQLGMNYDRNGSTMLNFFGVGVSMELPLFNRNTGKIKQALISIQNAKLQQEQATLTLENEIALSYTSLRQAIDFLKRIAPGYETELDSLLEKYTQNLTTRNVGMVEYFDFIDAFLNNKKIILEAQKEVNQKIEEFHYALGSDL